MGYVVDWISWHSTDLRSLNRPYHQIEVRVYKKGILFLRVFRKVPPSPQVYHVLFSFPTYLKATNAAKILTNALNVVDDDSQ